MSTEALLLAEKLSERRSLTEEEYARLITGRDEAVAARLAELADAERRRVYGTDVYVRGLIEIGSFCKNDCLYCGIRRSNKNAQRYRLTPDEILSLCGEGYALGFRTFVLQGGEDPYYTDDILCALIKSVKGRYPDCAVTLSLGERGAESFRRLYDAGADRYLLRHETADREHYGRLHPPEMSFDGRMRCLRQLRETGFQVGCGFMVGSPFQTPRTLAKDLKFIEEFRPDMCGIGPFVPHRDTVFRDEPAGSAELTVYLLSIIRVMLPHVLLPATTALATVDPRGREKGVLAGANVVMPNLSPVEVRDKYSLYDGKACTGEEAAQCVACLDARMRSIGFRTVVSRGDVKR